MTQLGVSVFMLEEAMKKKDSVLPPPKKKSKTEKENRPPVAAVSRPSSASSSASSSATSSASVISSAENVTNNVEVPANVLMSIHPSMMTNLAAPTSELLPSDQSMEARTNVLLPSESPVSFPCPNNVRFEFDHLGHLLTNVTNEL